VHSQGMIGDIDPAYPGMECYAGEAKGGDQYFLYSASGKRLSDKDIGSLTPRPVWWDADEFKEVNINRNLLKFKGDTLLKIEGKVILIADITGDWREEIVTSLQGELRIYSTNIPATNRKICLMQNRQYRLGTANSSMGYFYPPQLGLDHR
jgi:rhamnogalacturonan endolyase